MFYKVVISVNGTLTDLCMKVGEAGEAFFVVESFNTGYASSEYATSPIPQPSDIPDEVSFLFL